MYNFRWQKLQENVLVFVPLSFWREPYKISKWPLAQFFRTVPSSFSELKLDLARSYLPERGAFLYENTNSYVGRRFYPQCNVCILMAGGNSKVVRQITRRPASYSLGSASETPNLVEKQFLMNEG